MTKVILPITNGFYATDTLPSSSQVCQNWYVRVNQVASLSQEMLIGTPGSVELANSGPTQQQNRGGWALNGIPYFVNGGGLYRLNQTLFGENLVYSVEAVGAIAGTGRVSMSDNGIQLCIVVPGNPSTGYIFTEDPDTLTEITDPDFKANGEPQIVTFSDGYFIFSTDSKRWIVSNLNDGLVYTATDRGSAEADPDSIVAPFVFRNQVFMGGSKTTEAFQNIGGAGFPYQRTGLIIPKGVSAPYSFVEIDRTFLFIGRGANESPAVWSFTGNGVEKVSNDAVDAILQSYSEEEIGQTFSVGYSDAGSYFAAFTVGEDTVVFDVASEKWHTRASQYVDGREITIFTRWRVNSLVEAYGQLIVADSVDGRIGRLTREVYTEYGNPIIRKVSTQPFQNNMESFSLPYVELTMEAGVGNSEAPDPEVRMRRSIDGGKTWYDNRSRKIGKVGEYRNRTIWRMNGRAERFEVLEFTLSDAVKPRILQLTADIVTGDS